MIAHTIKIEIHENGDVIWFLEDNMHRLCGPAVEYANGNKAWYLNGRRHRKDGPAIEYANGNKAWFLSDTEFTEQEFIEATNVDI